MEEETVRTTVVFPKRTAELLREHIPARKRSSFIAAAVLEKLMEGVFRKGREESFGAWRDEDHPDLQTAEDMERYIAALRSNEDWRRPSGEG